MLIAVPQQPFDAAERLQQPFPFRPIVVGGAVGVLFEHGQPHGDVEPIEHVLRGGSDALCERLGRKRSLIAVAHTMLTSAYHLLQRKQAYQELGPDYFERFSQSLSRRTSYADSNDSATKSFCSQLHQLEVISKESLPCPE